MAYNVSIDPSARGTTFDKTVRARLSVIVCGKCGGIYAIAERFRRLREERGGGWNCPYCKCDWGFWGKTEAQKERARAARASARAREMTARAETAEREPSEKHGGAS